MILNFWRKSFLITGKIYGKKLAHPYAYFISIEHYQKPVDKLKIEDFFSKLIIACPDDSEIDRRNQIIKLFDSKIGVELTRLHMRTDIILLKDFVEKFIKKNLVKNME